MIVLPMAGRSQRFKDAGFSKPKWQLPLAGKTILEYVFLSFCTENFDEPLLVVSREDSDGVQLIREAAQRVQVLNRTEIVNLSNPTRGQAETVYEGLQQSSAHGDEPITIFNVDTLRPGYKPSSRQLASDGWLECFSGEGDAWSFVLPADNGPGKVAKVTEKSRISDLCCTGMYYFSSVQLYEWAYRRQLDINPYPELFVAPLYNHLIERGLSVTYNWVDASLLYLCGTPADYTRCFGRSEKISKHFLGVARTLVSEDNEMDDFCVEGGPGARFGDMLT